MNHLNLKIVICLRLNFRQYFNKEYYEITNEPN